ncbi:MAG TPA: molybdopterin oxidoreductase family protein [Ktedonobacterales bacterium]|nr:molybdopterin oxidoreductase family protein [Ktedonobacterales bacterium]
MTTATASETTAETKTSYLTCPLCEATCGLAVVTRGREVVSIRGDEHDPLSHGYLCPKATGLKALDDDPDRIRTPMIREGATWRAVSWDDAFAEIERRLPPIIQAHGRDALALFLGNPNVHTLAGQLYLPALTQAARTRNTYTASTLDQMPKHVSSGLMFGSALSIPIPDVDNTHYLLILGANPLVSNGSLMTAPDMRGRLRRLRARGGKLVVIDPRRTRTAQEADEHHYIWPGTDAAFLFAIVHTLFAENLVAPGRLADHLNGLDELRAQAAPFTPEAVAPVCHIAPETIHRIARELAQAERAAVYGRIGACTQEFGTLTSWLVDVVNALTGNLDRVGGALFPKAAAGARNTQGEPGRGKGARPYSGKSRVRGLPEVYGERPAVCLAEEMLTPGEGQVRALITVAGNPALSVPNGDELARALEQVEFMVSVDIYLNETTRHAHVILPALSPLEDAHYDLAFYQLAVRNVARYSPPLFAHAPGQLEEWEALLRLSAIVMGAGTQTPVPALDDIVATQVIQRETRLAGSPVEGRDPAELLAALQPRRGPERLLDFLLRVGPYGDGFGANPDGLTLAQLEAQPHGLDLGPLQSRIPEVLRTPSGKIELAPAEIVADVPRLRAALTDTPHLSPSAAPTLLLIGRRELRSNNSWMHNLPTLVKGKDLCTLLMAPADAARLGLADGDRARITSGAGTVEAPVELTDDIMPGVVSLPHGWGHGQPGARLGVAAQHAGANANRLTESTRVDPLSGDAILNGVPVTVTRVAVEEGAESAWEPASVGAGE